MTTAMKATVRKSPVGVWTTVLPDGRIALSMLKSEAKELADSYNCGTISEATLACFNRPSNYLDGPHAMDPMDDQYAG